MASTPRRNLRLPSRNLQHDENALFYDHRQYRILRGYLSKIVRQTRDRLMQNY